MSQGMVDGGLQRGQLAILERIASGEPLRSVLARIVTLIESTSREGIGSVLLLDREGKHVRHGAAPRLPIGFIGAIDGLAIGPQEGSCGAAAALKQRVIVEDIATHPNWTPYRAVALAYDLRACWSSPILSRAGDVLGTFAIYYTRPRGPTEAELATADIATHLAAIAIERERMDDDLRASELRYRQIYESVSDVIFHIAVERDGFRFVAINPAFTVATGLPVDAVRGKRVEDVIPPPAHELVLGSYRRAIAERRTVAWEETSEYPAGRKVGHVQVAPIYDAEGVCTHLVGTVHDVTAYKRAEAEIAAQAALLDKTHDAILVLDLAGTIRFWNDGAHRLYGYTREEAIGRPFAELVGADVSDHDGAAEGMRTTRAGQDRVVESSVTVVRDPSGAPESLLVIETDITERKAMEARFQRTQRLESLGILAGGVAHDFNNILTGILGNLEVAMRWAASDPRIAPALAEIEKASWRASDLTRRILTFGRRTTSGRAPIDLRVPIAEATALLGATVMPPIALHTNMHGDAPVVLGDSSAIHQVVMNLGTNAIHAIGDKPGQIDVSLSAVTLDEPRAATAGTLRAGRYALISVHDTGGGIDRATMERMFEPFFTTKNAHGTGLGLSVVHGIVASHDGAIDVESERGHGTTFRVYLPAIAEQAAAPVRPSSTTIAGAPMRLALFVDDEATIVELARKILPERGYRVEAFTDPAAALRAFEAQPHAYAVLVTDSAMRPMSGFELARAARRIRPELPIVMMASHPRDGDDVAAAELGIAEVLAKPIQFDQIVGSIDRLFAP